MRTALTIFCLMLTVSVNAQEWFQDFNAARIQSRNEDKNMFLLFSGRDWYKPFMHTTPTLNSTPQITIKVGSSATSSEYEFNMLRLLEFSNSVANQELG